MAKKKKKDSVVVTKSEIRIKNLTIEDPFAAEYLYEHKGDRKKLVKELKKVIRVGAHALSDDRLINLIHKIEKDLAVDLQSLKNKLLIMEEEGATTRGEKFEDVMAEEVADIASTFGDVSKQTGTETGEVLNSKKGDVVVTLNPEDTFGDEKKVVFEIKTQNFTLGDTFNELEEARQNRAADEAVIVFSQGAEPKECGVFNRYPQYGIACAVDDETMETLPLELAYRFARTAIISNLREKEGVEMDGSKVADLLAQAKRNLSVISNVKRDITKSKKSADSAYESLDEMQENINEIFDEIDSAISG